MPYAPHSVHSLLQDFSLKARQYPCRRIVRQSIVQKTEPCTQCIQVPLWKEQITVPLSDFGTQTEQTPHAILDNSSQNFLWSKVLWSLHLHQIWSLQATRLSVQSHQTTVKFCSGLSKEACCHSANRGNSCIPAALLG